MLTTECYTSGIVDIWVVEFKKGKHNLGPTAFEGLIVTKKDFVLGWSLRENEQEVTWREAFGDQYQSKSESSTLVF